MSQLCSGGEGGARSDNDALDTSRLSFFDTQEGEDTPAMHGGRRDWYTKVCGLARGRCFRYAKDMCILRKASWTVPDGRMAQLCKGGPTD